jgi:hypothetical protein
VDAVLAPDFDNLAAVLATRWLYGKGIHGFWLALALLGFVLWIVGCFVPIRTKNEAVIWGPSSLLCLASEPPGPGLR